MGERARIEVDELFPSSHSLSQPVRGTWERARVKGLVKVGVHVSIPASASV